MSELCKLCGQEMENGVCPVDHSFKKMCLNCQDVSDKGEGTYLCTNADNLNAALEKMKAAAEKIGGYSIENIEIKPLPLKKPTCKCGNWALSSDVRNSLEELFK